MIDFRSVQKPQRYIGNEWNVTKKVHGGKITICLSYPDIYEIGMSNLGLRIIYGLLNTYSNVVCERVFMPGLDVIELLKTSKTKLFSLETKTSLCDFDVVGFNFGHELNFTNFLHILDLGAISLEQKTRKDLIVIGGGIINPEPIAEFVDVLYLGEFEEKASEFIDILSRYKDKETRLKALSQIPGFYVPKFYSSRLQGDTYSFEKKYPQANFPLKKVYLKDLNSAFFPRDWLTPHTQIAQDRVTVEIARGCPNQCVFCQAQAVYRPYRERKVEVIENIIKDTYEKSGYENFSFLSLSASDYSSIEQLIDLSGGYFKKRQIGLSLPSLRIDDILGRLSRKLNLIKKTSLTVAVEAANPSLRAKLNKYIDIKMLFEAAKVLKSLKLKHIKVYFMFGFPQETDDDLISIGDFLWELQKSSGLRINASINMFIPKPFSIWENIPMDSEKTLKRKKEIILKNIPRTKNIKVSIASTKKSLLEAILCQADREFSSVVCNAYKMGAKFDGYLEHFNWDIWQKAMAENGLDYAQILETKTKNFPWSFIARQ